MPNSESFVIIQYDPLRSSSVNKTRPNTKTSKKKLIDRLSILDEEINKVLNHLNFDENQALIKDNEVGSYGKDLKNALEHKKLVIKYYIIWVVGILNKENGVKSKQENDLIEKNISNASKILNSVENSLFKYLNEFKLSPLDPLLKRNKNFKASINSNSFGEVVQNGLLVVEENYFMYNIIFSKERLVSSIRSPTPSFFSYIALCLLTFSSNITSNNQGIGVLNNFYEKACLLLPGVYANPNIYDLAALFQLTSLSFFLCDYQRMFKATMMITRLAFMLKINEVDLRLVTDQTSIEEIKDLVIKRRLWELICNRVFLFEVCGAPFPSLLANFSRTESQLDLIQKLEERFNNTNKVVSFSQSSFSELKLKIQKLVFNVFNFIHSKLLPGIPLKKLLPSELRLPKYQIDEAQNVIDFYLTRYYQPHQYSMKDNLSISSKPTIPLMDIPLDYLSNFKYLKPISEVISIFSLQIYLLYPSAFIYPVPLDLSMWEFKSILNAAFNQMQILFITCYIYFESISNCAHSFNQTSTKNLERINNFMRKYPEPQVQITLKKLNSVNLRAIQLLHTLAYFYCYLNALSSPTFISAHHPCSPYLTDMKDQMIIYLEIIAIFKNFESSEDRLDVDMTIASLKEHALKFPIGPNFDINLNYYLS